MKIIYVHQYFLKPEEGGAIRSWHLAKALIRAGHEVEMITAHNHPEYQEDHTEGIRIHYMPVFYENNLGYFGRLISFIKFIHRAYTKARTIRDADICYATSTPLTIGIIALLLRRFHKLDYYFEVRDLWPEAPIQIGAIRNYFLKQYLYWLEKKIYRRAKKIIALSPGILEGVKKIVPKKEIHLIPNFSDCDFFFPENKNPESIKKFGVQGKFVISYFGALGKANHLEHLINTAYSLKQDKISNIHFIVAGRGSELMMLKEKIKELDLHNVSFPGYFNKERLHEMLNVSDAIYISFLNKPILQTNSPNKFFDGLAAGKLCITNIRGWICDLIEQNNCGFYYDPEKPEGFYEKLKPYLSQPDLLQTAQQNARRLAETQFSKTIMEERFLKLFIK